MKMDVTEVPQLAKNTYRVTQYVTVEMEVDVEATSADNAKQKAGEWSPTAWDDYCEKNTYWDENEDLRCEKFTLHWEITDVKDVEPMNVVELEDE